MFLKDGLNIVKRLNLLSKNKVKRLDDFVNCIMILDEYKFKAKEQINTVKEKEVYNEIIEIANTQIKALSNTYKPLINDDNLFYVYNYLVKESVDPKFTFSDEEAINSNYRYYVSNAMQFLYDISLNKNNFEKNKYRHLINKAAESNKYNMSKTGRSSFVLDSSLYELLINSYMGLESKKSRWSYE